MVHDRKYASRPIDAQELACRGFTADALQSFARLLRESIVEELKRLDALASVVSGQSVDPGDIVLAGEYLVDHPELKERAKLLEVKRSA